MQQDHDFAKLNQRLHSDHALSPNLKVVGLTVFHGLPELVVVDKSQSHEKQTVKALAVSAESGQLTGTFSKDEHNNLRHSAFEEKPKNFLPIPLLAGGTIWRDRNGEGQIREIDTPNGLKELINYDPRGHVQRLDLINENTSSQSYLRNDDGSYDLLGPHQTVVRGLVNDINIVDDQSLNTGNIVFSMHGGQMTKWMLPNGRVKAVY
jgi:hypothetical protein